MAMLLLKTNNFNFARFESLHQLDSPRLIREEIMPGHRITVDKDSPCANLVIDPVLRHVCFL
jgi:hypothetical protein